MAEKQAQLSSFVSAATRVGPVRSGNEDALLVTEDNVTELGSLYVVADGVGGQAFGAEASQLTVETIQQTFYALRESGTPIQSALKGAIEQANQAVFTEAQTRKGRMGSTVVTAVQHQEQLYLAHVGDARAYLWRDQKLHRLTRDHTWVQEQVESGLITPKQAEKHELRNVITRVLGNKESVTATLSKPLALQSNDIILLCSDGLYDTLSKDELAQILATTPIPQAADQLVAAAEAAGAGDNITAIVLNSGQIADSSSPLPWKWLAAAGLLLLIGLFVWLNPLQTSLGGNAAAPTLLPTAAVDGTNALSIPNSTATPEPAATSTLRPTETPTAVHTATPISTETAVSTPLLSCASAAGAFVWQESSLNRTDCPAAITDMFLGPNEPVDILNATAVPALGPDRECNRGFFIEIQSQVRPEIRGWVAETQIRQGEICPAP